MASVELLQVGEEVDREKLLRRFDASGFQRTSLVEERGDYSVRGGVIDLFPPLYNNPLRVEFLGDKVESLRLFDPLSQRSLRSLKEAIVLPANEIIMGEGNVQRARSMGRLPALMKEWALSPGRRHGLSTSTNIWTRFSTTFPIKGFSSPWMISKLKRSSILQ